MIEFKEKRKEALHPRREFSDMRDLVESVGELFGERTAFSFRKKPMDKEVIKISYSQLRDDVRALSSEFIKRGFKGKNCAVIGKLSYNWILCYFSLIISGAVLVPLDRDWLSEDLTDTVKKAGASFLIVDSDIREKGDYIKTNIPEIERFFLSTEADNGESVDELLKLGRVAYEENPDAYHSMEQQADALSILVFTSGTTGKGKGVMLSQQNVLTNIIDAVEFIDFSEKTVGVLPPHHTFGSTVSIVGHLSIGVEVYISAGLKYIQKELKEEKPGHLVLVPLYLETFYRKILANIKAQNKEKLVGRMIKLSRFLRCLGIDLRKKLFAKIREAFGGELRTVISGGAPLNREIVEFFDGIGITILNGYGITECAPIIAVNHSVKNRIGSVGPAIPSDEVVIENPNEDGEGEILVRGANVMLGYFKDEEATAQAIDKDGFFHTGDYGKLGKDKEIYITGRLKNLIILSNGKNVYPEEIENELIAVPGVLDIVVYEGQSKRGTAYNAIVAEIYPDEEYLAKNGITDVKAYFDPYIASYNKTAVPYKKIAILKVRKEPFPKNTLKKIMRFKMDLTID